jgi:ankyrin repeat protein
MTPDEFDRRARDAMSEKRAWFQSVGLLQEAISRRDTKSALQLIEAGVELNTQDSDGRTALHYAAIFAKRRGTDLLLRRESESRRPARQ